MTMGRTVAARLAWVTVGASAALIAGGAIIAAGNHPLAVPATGPGYGPKEPTATLAFGGGILVFSVVGALIASRQPSNSIGWLLCGTGAVFSFGLFSGAYSYGALQSDPGSLPAGTVFGVLSDTLWLPTIAFTTVFLFLLFPGGRPTGLGERITLWAAIAAIAASIAGGLTEANLYGAPKIEGPLRDALPTGFSAALVGIGFVVVIASAVASTVLLIRRFRRSRDEERQQLKWFVSAASLVLVTTIPTNLLSQVPPWLLFVDFVAVLTLPVAVGIAILKYRLYDIDVVIKKTLIAVVLAMLLAGVGLVVVAIAGQVAFWRGTPKEISILVGIVFGLLFAPLLHVSRRIANRLVYGRRATPYEALSTFSTRVAETYSIDDVLPRLAQVLAAGTGASSARVLLRVGPDLREVAAHGAPGGSEYVTPVTHQGEDLGALAVTFPANDPMNPEKERLIDDMAKQAGLVLRNVRLIEELRASRRRIISAQDDRARALERNIHDGAQQELVALAVKLRLARGLMTKDVAAVESMLTELEAASQSALENLRDLARGIYPPLLADRGLPAALEAQARKSTIEVTLEPDGVGRYPRDVESAVYFCALEALNNVAKYAGTTRATIRLVHEGNELSFEVRDEGRGFDQRSTGYGTGLQGMADRLDAIGGSLSVDSRPGAGTTVAGRVPVRGSDGSP
jgi:signal transduction histidine kinase